MYDSLRLVLVRVSVGLRKIVEKVPSEIGYPKKISRDGSRNGNTNCVVNTSIRDIVIHCKTYFVWILRFNKCCYREFWQ